MIGETWCPVCGELFTPKINHKDKKPTETCSKKCGAIRREVRKGKR